MRVLFVGPAAECRGFALAGVAWRVCDSIPRAEQLLASARERGSGIGLVLLARELAGCGAGDRSLRALETPPAVTLLPEPRSASPGRPEDAP